MNPSVRAPWVSLMALLFAAAGEAFAQAGVEPGLVATGEFVSERMHRGLEQADQSAHVGVAWRGEAWNASWNAFVPVRSDDPAEWQLAGGWGRSLGENLSFETSLRWSHFTRVQGGMAEDTLEAGVAAAWLLPREVKLGAAAFRDFTLKATTVEGSLAYSHALTKLGAYLDLRGFLGWSEGDDWRPRGAGPPVAGGYGYFGAEAALPYRIGELTSVVLGVAYTEAWNARDEGHLPARGGRRNLVWRFGVTFEF